MTRPMNMSRSLGFLIGVFGTLPSCEEMPAHNKDPDAVLKSSQRNQGGWLLKWEPIAMHTGRLKVHGGWIVTTPGSKHTIFVADPDHEWELDR